MTEGALPLPADAVKAARVEIPPEGKSRDRQDYLLIRDAFRRFRRTMENSAESWEAMEDIITLRASFLVDRMLTGLAMDFDTALELLRNFNDFTTERERQQRDILVAAIENLVDFAAAEELAMVDEVDELPEGADEEMCEEVCEKYNLTYATAENDNVEHAALMAAWWIGIMDESIVTYMTQGDERVRATHLSLEGTSYRKSEFPAELIPPIEWACRCYLVADGMSSVHGALPAHKDYRKLVNPVFAQSLAKGGKIFTEAHPYFRKPLPTEAQKITERIKRKLHLYGN